MDDYIREMSGAEMKNRVKDLSDWVFGCIAEIKIHGDSNYRVRPTHDRKKWKKLDNRFKPSDRELCYTLSCYLGLDEEKVKERLLPEYIDFRDNRRSFIEKLTKWKNDGEK